MKNKTDKELVEQLIIKETDAISEFLGNALYDLYVNKELENYEKCANIQEQIEIYITMFATTMKLFMGTDVEKTRETLQVVMDDINHKLEKNRENILNNLPSSEF